MSHADEALTGHVSQHPELERFSAMLWREREMFTELSYRIELQGLVLAAGRVRWINRVADDVARIVDRMKEVEALRILATQEITEHLGLPSNASLVEIARACDEPWTSIFLEHRAALLEYGNLLTNAAVDNREMIATGSRGLRETLLGMGAGATGDLAEAATAAGTAGRHPRFRNDAAPAVFFDQPL